jgi:hypothetical protein
MREVLRLSKKSNSPPIAERRPKQRKRVLLTGIVTYANGAHSFNCTMRDLSETGARIAVGESAQFPSDFYLINIRDRIAYKATPVWNNGSEIGVAFKAAIPLSAITDPALNYLKKLYLAKTAR